MIHIICIILVTIIIPIQAMDSPPSALTQYIKTKTPTLKKKNPTIQKLHKNLLHKRNHLKEKLEDKPDVFWMWTPDDGAFHSLYKAKSKDDIDKLIKVCNPSMRICGKYSIFSSIIMAPHISFQEKKEILSTLYTQNYKPTIADKKINFIETWERCEEKKIIKNICLFLWGYNNNDLFPEFPKDLKDAIAQRIIFELTFNSESLL